MVIVSTSHFQPALLQPLVTALLSCSVPVLSIINTVVPCQSIAKRERSHSRRKTRTKAAAVREGSHVLHGTSSITERLCGLNFEISPSSFFQVNSDQAAMLYTHVRKFAGRTR